MPSCKNTKFFKSSQVLVMCSDFLCTFRNVTLESTLQSLIHWISQHLMNKPLVQKDNHRVACHTSGLLITVTANVIR